MTLVDTAAASVPSALFFLDGNIISTGFLWAEMWLCLKEKEGLQLLG